MPVTEKRKQWLKENTTRISIKLSNNTDADILQALEGKQKQTEIKRLLRIALAARIAAIPEAEPDEWDVRMMKAAERDREDPDNDAMLYSDYVAACDN